MRKILGHVSIFIGMVAGAGWLFGELALASWGGDSVTMKAPTAAMCVLGGVAVAVRQRAVKWACGLAIAMIVASIVGAYFSGGSLTSMKDLPHDTVADGMPSWGTLLSFLALSVQRLAVLERPWLSIAGLLWWVGVLSLLGHLTGIAWLYWYVPKVSSGVAIGTAVALMSLGAGLAVEAVE